MYWEKRVNKNGQIVYSFAFYDKSSKKPVRLKKSEVPSDIDSDEKAEEFCRLKEAEREAGRMRVLQKLAWKNKFYDFAEILEIFKSEIKKKAPGSWENNVYYLEQYIFNFFLGAKQCNNLNNWSLFYHEFQEWLCNVKPSYGNKQSISYSTRNHVISCLNSFMEIMKVKRKVERLDKCRKFPTHLLNVRDIEDVYTDGEIEEILIHLDAELSDLFRVLLKTGLRISECLGLSLDDFYVGEPEHDTLKKSLNKHGLVSFGYLAIESQVADGKTVRDENGFVARKPLKGRKRIKSGEGRIIPIIDKDIFNILASRYNAQLEQLNGKAFGAESKNYLLFNGINRNTLNVALAKIYSKLGGKYKAKCQHCCRHTFSTNFVGMVQGDFFLAKAILGHKDVETTMRYVHIFEAMNRKARKSEQKKVGINLL